jgi:hypothetical protein
LEAEERLSLCKEMKGAGLGEHLALGDQVRVVDMAVGAVDLCPVRADGVGEGGEAVALFETGGAAMDLEDDAVGGGPDWGWGWERVAGDQANFDLAVV